MSLRSFALIASSLSLSLSSFAYADEIRINVGSIQGTLTAENFYINSAEAALECLFESQFEEDLPETLLKTEFSVMRTEDGGSKATFKIEGGSVEATYPDLNLSTCGYELYVRGVNSKGRDVSGKVTLAGSGITKTLTSAGDTLKMANDPKLTEKISKRLSNTTIRDTEWGTHCTTEPTPGAWGLHICYELIRSR